MIGRLVTWLIDRLRAAQSTPKVSVDWQRPQIGGERTGVLSAEAYCQQAEILRSQNRLEEARRVIDAALEIYPEDAGLNYRLGVLLLAMGDAEQAMDLFNLALHYRSDFFEACSAKLRALDSLGRAFEATGILSEFIECHPCHAQAAIALADRFYLEGNFKAVVNTLEPILESGAIDHGAANLLGLVLGREFGDFDRAEALLRRALDLSPDWLPAITNLGWNLLEQGRHAEGYACIERALQLAPEDVEARLVRACMLLKQGNFAEGWRDYGYRHASRFAIPRPYHFAQWRGESISNCTLLIYAEQGVGDQIMFASCFREVIERAGNVIIECNPKLVGLFRRSFPTAAIQENVPKGMEPVWLQSSRQIDFQVAMGDLPGMFRKSWGEFPDHHGYLTPEPALVRYWKQRLDELGNQYKLGVSWRGGTVATRRHLRSIDLEQLRQITNLRLTVVSLQYDVTDVETRKLGSGALHPIHHWQEAIDDYEQTAALIKSLDGVLTVCTAVVHLAGALGCKVWVLAPAVTEWRYLDKGDRLPWYPSAHVLRQKVVGDWEDALEAAVSLLREEESMGDGNRVTKTVS